MKILFIRHADPDYSIDNLTPTGVVEVECLHRYIDRYAIDHVYSSPMGRAYRTAQVAMGRDDIEVLPWLREFNHRVDSSIMPPSDIIWDKYPDEWSKCDGLYDKDAWYNHPMCGDVKDKYLEVCNGLDELLAKHGYEREGMIYRAVSPNREVIALFCHFGVQCILLSHLLGISPIPLLHHTCALPSSVTTLVTEERREGIASFRMLEFGSLNHLVQDGIEPSFSARFCETYDDMSERH